MKCNLTILWGFFIYSMCQHSMTPMSSFPKGLGHRCSLMYANIEFLSYYVMCTYIALSLRSVADIIAEQEFSKERR